MVIKKSDKSPIHIGFYNLIIKVLYQKKNSNSRGDINMRFSTYLNNKKCMEWQLNAQQGILFSLLYDCSNWAKEVIVDGQAYYFVSRNLVINELPMFFEKPDTVYREFKKLFEKGLIKYKKNEKMDLIRITEKGKEWNFSNSENNSEKNTSFEENSEKNPSKFGKKSENNSEKNTSFEENSEKNPSKFGKKSENNSEKNPTNKDNNIYYKDTNNKDNNIYSAVTDYLNEKTGRAGSEKYSPSSKETIKYIKARQNDGYKLEDFKIVIDNMVTAWTGTEWEQYLRPRTLFSNKFEDYLRWKNNKNITKKTSNNNDFIVTEESLAETFGRYK